MITKFGCILKPVRPFYWLTLLICVLSRTSAFPQPNKQDIPTQRLLLQLGACYLNVAKQNQIDIDSGLALAAQRSHINRLIVIGQSFEDIIFDRANDWVATEDIRAAKKIAATTVGSKHTRLLNLIGFFYAFQPAARKNDLDSALRYLTMAKQEAEMAGDMKSFCQSLSGIGKSYLEIGENSLAAASLTQAINQSVKSGYKEEEAMAWAFWGTYSLFQPKTILERINQMQKANALYELLNDRAQQVYMLTNIGYLSIAAGKLDESKQYILSALEIEKAMDFPYTHYSIDKLSLISFIKSDHENQLKYAMEEVKIVESNRDSIALAYIYARRADADLYFTSNTQQGIEWSKKALDEFKRLRDPAMYLTAYNVARVLVKEGKQEQSIFLVEDLLKEYPPVNPLDRQNLLLALGSAYESINFSKAEKYFLAAEALQRELPSVNANNNPISFYTDIGTFYLKYHQYDKSRTFLNMALRFPRVNARSVNIAFAHKSLSMLDSATGNFKDAYTHLTMFNIIQDSVREKTTNKQVDELRVRYETEKKDNNIKLLNQQAALQAVQIKQDKFTKNVMIAGAAVLVLFLGLLYNRFLLKQKINRQLEVQQKVITQKNNVLEQLLEEKEWLLKEVHHRVKNNLQIIISLLSNQAKYLKDDAAVDAIRESQQRMYAISLIHQKLYKGQDTATINMREYVYELVEQIKKGFSSASRIQFNLDILDVQVDVAQAVPLGLILNEAISNAFKYAIPNDDKGQVRISFVQSPVTDELKLIVADNGPGLPEDWDFTKTTSFGFRLMQGLSRQLHGNISIKNENGLLIELVFKNQNVIQLIRNEKIEHLLSQPLA